MTLSVCTDVEVFTVNIHITQLMWVQPLQLNGLLTASQLANRKEKVKQTENYKILPLHKKIAVALSICVMCQINITISDSPSTT